MSRDVEWSHDLPCSTDPPWSTDGLDAPERFRRVTVLLAGLAQDGLTYTGNHYERDRYAEGPHPAPARRRWSGSSS